MKHTFEKLSGKQLLERFTDDDEPFAEEAFEAFYYNYSKLIMSMCYKIASDWYKKDTVEVAEDLALMTFTAIYNNAKSFKKNRSLENWILGIIKNVFLKYLRQDKLAGKTIYINEDNIDLVENFQISLDSRESSPSWKAFLPNVSKDQLREAINTLNDRQKLILFVYLHSGEFDHNDQWHLDTSSMDYLCKKLGVTPNAIVQARRRLVIKIKKIVKA